MSCSEHNLITVSQAIAQIQETLEHKADVEWLSLAEAVNKVVAADQLSTLNVPPAANSAMDGYGFNAKDLAPDQLTQLPVGLRVAAGDQPGTLPSGMAARIFTGAFIPTNVDLVIPQELVKVTSDQVEVQPGWRIGQHIRNAGEDIAEGQQVVVAGKRLRPQELGLLASVGIMQVPVYKPLTVALFTTGDELIEPGRPLPDGKIYNSNRYTLMGLLQQGGFKIIDGGTLPDQHEATKQALLKASQQADAIITTGGVSVGEEDYVQDVIKENGTVHLWKLAIKPGKPLLYGQLNKKPVFGLPGNPISSLVTYLMVARPALQQMQGLHDTQPASYRFRAGFTKKKNLKRAEYLRVQLQSQLGEQTIVPYPKQGSGVLSSASWASGLALVPADTDVKPGDWLEYWPFSEFV
ncbi:gephyrin-like molybdotransferase Glp [Spartinivicinus poritis]|uniref:Molybdopterin molybdenumtransferase n=1 Tax=Spartinivicinus poritis TaxID=2994640 RepID=A0ABT5UES4_9GAMM|nr:gephyrin-like molybdotransferase Glp [Spartinivicinus sp. A2-2]MDE1464858.1 molybdopterin molybdotransferase MoeA [Spartinivicinus sp. A2-2]